MSSFEDSLSLTRMKEGMTLTFPEEKNHVNSQTAFICVMRFNCLKARLRK